MSRRPGPRRPARSPDRFARRRSRPRSRLAGALLAVLLAGLAGTGVWVIGWSDLLAVRAVSVRAGDRPLQGPLEQEVRAAAQAPLGVPLARVDTGALAARVAEVEDVRDVEVHRSWPRTLTVEVRLRRPAAAVRSAGRWRLVDAGGAVFGSAAEERPAGLPALVAPTDDRSAPARRAAMSVLAALPEALRASVVEVAAPGPADLRLRLRAGAAGEGRERTERTVEVMWGGPEASARKAEVLTALLGAAEGERYDVSAPERPAVTA